jgi:hypothetical protein
MKKKQIIDKILDDLPTSDMRGEMSHDEWYGWFEEAFDKGFKEALRIHDIKGKSEQCVLHSTDWNGECFKCGEQVFVREEK